MDEGCRNDHGVLSNFRDHGTPCEPAMGRVKESPFPREAVVSLKSRIINQLERSGFLLGRHEKDRTDTPVDFRFMHRSIGKFERGVKVGPGARLLRLPALYRPKRKWKLPGQENPDDYLDAGHDTEAVWRSNYPTVDELVEKVEEVLEDQVKRRQVLKLPEEVAKVRYPGLVIASLGANRKEKSDGSITARVLHDGSNGIAVNRRIRVRDQERCPMASDLKRAMREKAKRGETTFALTADVKEAHRQIPIAEEDWRLLGCRVRPATVVYIHTVGTFGISSASYYWSRIGSGIVRLVQYVVGNSAVTWIMLVADDFHLETSGADYRTGLITFFVICSLLGVPLSWPKTSDGDTLTWVGFEMLHRSCRLGISRPRAEWFCRWCQETPRAESVNMSSFEKGLGRITYVAGGS